MKIPSRPIWSAPSCWLVFHILFVFFFPSPTPILYKIFYARHLDSSRAIPESLTAECCLMKPTSYNHMCVCVEGLYGKSFWSTLWSYKQHAAIIYHWSNRDRSSPAIFDGVPTRPPWNPLTTNCTRDLCYRAWITSAFRSSGEKCWRTIPSGTLMSSVWRSSPASGERNWCQRYQALYVDALVKSHIIIIFFRVRSVGRWCGSAWQSWLVSKCRERSIATKLPCKTGWRWSKPITTRQIRTTIQHTQLTSSNRRPISSSATASRHFSTLLI